MCLCYFKVVFSWKPSSSPLSSWQLTLPPQYGLEAYWLHDWYLVYVNQIFDHTFNSVPATKLNISEIFTLQRDVNLNCALFYVAFTQQTNLYWLYKIHSSFIYLRDTVVNLFYDGTFWNGLIKFCQQFRNQFCFQNQLLVITILLHTINYCHNYFIWYFLLFTGF